MVRSKLDPLEENGFSVCWWLNNRLKMPGMLCLDTPVVFCR